MSSGRVATLLVGVSGFLLVLAAASVTLAPGEQAIFGLLTAATFLVANRFPSRQVTMFLVMLSMAASLRYLVWRCSDTLKFGSTLELCLGSCLLMAEFYACVVLALGYIQSTWPLERKPAPLPDDLAAWPTVDVFIPTYNEPLSVVRATVFSAMAMDYPQDKFKVYILDDGKREEFRRFAQSCGAGYFTRDGNDHAKAGNLNAAMARTSGEIIAIFDCDHIPTRAFLQMTVGWLHHDRHLAMVQTPHFFYSPDPFQRNLAAGTRVPSEGNLFYGLLQDGNDYWNASFFCGSCAVLRRAALDSVGGFAVETVTEDAHTMLRLHRSGWDSAYLRLPLAAGLATERLVQHIGQRQRWARGMLQLLRIDNPLFGPGLTLGQRLCYLQAMGHFLFAIPRLIFLTSPLAYLLFGQSIIAASPLAIAAYALPHLFHCVGTTSRIHKHWRHSFWSEIYETVMAPFLVRVTLATLISPRRGRFNVTAKGGRLENGYFDLRAVYPHLILALLLVCGVVRGVASLLLFDNELLVFQALLLNSIWAALSLLMVLAALAVGREARQVRTRARTQAVVKVAIRLPDGSSVDGVTSTLSQSGGQVDLAALDRPIDPASIEGADVEASFAVGANWLTVPVRIVRWGDSSLQLRFRVASVTEEAKVVRIVFGRADAWIDWAAYPEDHPLASLWRVLVSIGGLFRAPDAAPPAASPPTPLVPPRRIARVGRLAAIMLLCMLPPATAQVPGSLTIRPIAQPVAPLPPVEMPAPTAGVRVIRRTLHELGVPGPLTLRGTSPLQGVQFGVRADEVVTEATLDVVGAMSPALIPAFSNDTVTLNEQYVGTIPVVPSAPTFNLRIPLSPVFFQDINRLNFNFSGRYTNDCMDPLSTLLWSTVYDSSTLTLTLQRLPPQRELQRLPLPFFDPREQTQLTLPFLLPANPSNPALTAAGIVASWFGQLSAFRGAVFPVLATPPTEGNAVLVVVGDTAPAGMALPPITGPTVGVIANPADKLSSLLLIAGRTGEEAVVAAQALVLGSRALAGSVTGVSAPEIAVRKPYDAPAWIPTDRPVRFGELAPPEDLQVHGYTGLVHVPFRTAPDLVTWRNHGFAERLRWRAPDAPVVDVAPSRFDAGINGVYLDSFSLAASPHAPSWLAWLTSPGGAPREVRMDVPPYALASSNDLQFFFDARPLNRGKCVATPQDIRMALDPESSIDLSRAYRFTSMPNLGFFAGSGFPFTRMADLSSTAVVLPERPTPVEIGAFLTMMGRFGSLTGIPSVRVAVVRPNQVATLADRDLLLMSTLPHLGSAASLLSDTRLRVEGERVTMVLPTPFDRVRAWFGESGARDRAEAATRFTAAFGESGMAMVGGESPLAAGKSLVALLAGEPQGLDAIVASLRDPDRARQIQGDLALLSADRVTSYRVGPRYYVGWLPPWMWPDLLLRDQPFGLFGLVAGGSLLLGLAMFWAMRRRAAWRVRQLAERLQ